MALIATVRLSEFRTKGPNLIRLTQVYTVMSIKFPLERTIVPLTFTNHYEMIIPSRYDWNCVTHLKDTMKRIFTDGSELNNKVGRGFKNQNKTFRENYKMIKDVYFIRSLI